jgi:hypothetical protein
MSYSQLSIALRRQGRPPAPERRINPVDNRGKIPVHLVFSPSWWFHHYGVSFEEPSYLDPETRIRNDVLMRAALYQRFGLGQPHPQPRPVIGSRHIAGGFVVPALLGVKPRFSRDQAAWPVPLDLDRQSALGLRVPGLDSTWPMDVLIRQMDQLQQQFGYVTGDLNTAGLVNTAIELRGQQFFLDLVEDAELADHILGVVAVTQAAVALAVKSRTGTCAIATNRSILSADPATYLTSNCSVQMISPALYEARVLKFEQYLADRLRPYGIHHCGNNLQLYIKAYSQVAPCFLDVGWGSDVARSSAELPDAFLNLRLSPVRVLQCGEQEIYGDVRGLLGAAARRERVGVCCINMDRDTPDGNIRAMSQAVRDYEAEAL